MGGSIFEESKRMGEVYIGRKMRVGWGVGVYLKLIKEWRMWVEGDIFKHNKIKGVKHYRK